MSTTRTVGAALRAHYGRATIGEEARSRLRIIARSHPKTRLPSRRAVWLTAVAGASALVVLIVGLVMPYVRSARHGVQPDALAAVVVDEVRALHAAASPPALSAARFEDLGALSEPLGFAPTAPSRLDPEDYVLIGGRATRLAGQPAAEFTLRAKNGERCTLVQTPASRIPPYFERVREGNLWVTTWRENNFFYAFVRPAG